MKFPRRLAIPFVLAALHAAAGGSSVRADDGDEVDQGDGFVVPPPPEASASRSSRSAHSSALSSARASPPRHDSSGSATDVAPAARHRHARATAA